MHFKIVYVQGDSIYDVLKEVEEAVNAYISKLRWPDSGFHVKKKHLHCSDVRVDRGSTVTVTAFVTVTHNAEPPDEEE